jgi:hypothetical protein
MLSFPGCLVDVQGLHRHPLVWHFYDEIAFQK